MLCKSIFIVVTFFAATSYALPRQVKLNEPERCCVPELFSCQISTSNGMKLPDGTTFSSFGYYNFSYDANRGMVGMKGVSFSIPEQVSSNLWIIENMNDGQIYTFDLDSKKCFKSKNPLQPIRCIPESATYLHSFNYGYGDKQILADTWAIKLDNSINYSTVSRDGLCIPFTGQNFISEPPLVSTVTMTDFQPKIDDPSIFDIPAECMTIV